MRAKFVNETIKHLSPKSKEEILQQVNGRKDAIFKRSNKEVSYGLTDYINVSFKIIKKLFGSPDNADGYKVSTYWVVEDDHGNIAEIYDYKATNLYANFLPSVKQFRTFPSYEWHIGAKNKSIANDLITYIILNS